MDDATDATDEDMEKMLKALKGDRTTVTIMSRLSVESDDLNAKIAQGKRVAVFSEWKPILIGGPGTEGMSRFQRFFLVTREQAQELIDAGAAPSSGSSI